MALAREGVPIILSFVAGHVVFLAAGLYAHALPLPSWARPVLMTVAVVFAVLALFSLYFFRDPDRATPEGEGLVISPADGRVLGIERVQENEFIGGPADKLSIFMNVFDVHVNRSPVHGTVEYENYRPGKFLNASLDKASEHNEAMTLGIESPAHGKLLLRQIAGLVARRIVCRVEKGDTLDAGQRFGLIRFGSRVEVFLPPGVEWKVAAGDRVYAGQTVLAERK